MDGTSFDRIARALGGGLTRRSGIFGALGALAGFGAGLLASDGIAAKGKGKETDSHGPSVAAPCGKGRKKNVCKKNSDCCTNICKTNIKNKDGSGRCRCEKKGRPCSEDRNCCGSVRCVAGKCGGKAPMVDTGAACRPNDVCRDPNAECTSYEFDIPAGTYCLLPVQGLCSAGSDCVSSRCRDGVCRPCSIAACVEACTPKVCATCAYTTVQAAIDAAADGDVIAIGKGTWVENLTASKNLTLRACPGERVTLRNSSYANRTIAVTGGKSLTLLDITVDGYHDRTNGNSGGGISSDGSVTLAGTTVIRNAGWKQRGAGIRLVSSGKTLTVTDEVEVRDTESDSYGGGMYVEGPCDVVISGWAQVADNYSDSYGAGVHGFGGVNLTISDSVRITRNRGQYGGAGVTVANWTASRATTVTIQDDVVISDNLSFGNNTDGCGLLIYGNSNGPVTALVTDRVLIAGNAAPLSNSGGGGVMVSRWVAATISGDVEISGNSSSNGGGVNAYWKPNDRPAGWVSLTITDSVTITDNTATVAGGGVMAFGTTVEVTGSALVSGNRAPKGAGAFINYQSVVASGVHPGALTVSGGGKITGNIATDAAPSGGGVWSDNNDNTLTAAAGSITGNTPDQCAGGTISC